MTDEDKLAPVVPNYIGNVFTAILIGLGVSAVWSFWYWLRTGRGQEPLTCLDNNFVGGWQVVWEQAAGLHARSAPVVVCLHGRGDSASDLLRRMVKAEVRATLVVPRSGVDLTTGGSAWVISTDPESLDAVAASLVPLFVELRRCMPLVRLVCYAEGQGADVGLRLLARQPRLADHIVAVGGDLPPLGVGLPFAQLVTSDPSVVAAAEAYRDAGIDVAVVPPRHDRNVGLDELFRLAAA